MSDSVNEIPPSESSDDSEEPALRPARPVPTPAALASRVAPSAEAPSAEAAEAAAEFGRVDDLGNVFVRTREGERLVGQWTEGDTAAAFAFFYKRFEGLKVEVDLVSRRIEANSVSPEEARATLGKIRAAVLEAPAVGDLDGLLERLDALGPVIEEQRTARRAERAAKVEQAKTEKLRIVAAAESLAAGSNWRTGADDLRDLLQTWKALPRIDRATDDDLWHRFSAARTTYTRRRKQHFSELSSQRDESRIAKEKLIAEAVALSGSREWGATAGAYRDLMTRWKAVGRGSKAVDDALWKRFRAAQDTFFESRDAANSELDDEYGANADVKRSLLVEAERLLPVTNPSRARAAFRVIADKWDAAGKVPRKDVRELEDRFKAVESTIRGAEDDSWRRTNPEVHARASETVRKLELVIESLRKDLAKAEAAGDAKSASEAQAALEARQQWLDQARRSQSQVGA